MLACCIPKSAQECYRSHQDADKNQNGNDPGHLSGSADVGNGLQDRVGIQTGNFTGILCGTDCVCKLHAVLRT